MECIKIVLFVSILLFSPSTAGYNGGTIWCQPGTRRQCLPGSSCPRPPPELQGMPDMLVPELGGFKRIRQVQLLSNPSRQTGLLLVAT